MIDRPPQRARRPFSLRVPPETRRRRTHLRKVCSVSLCRYRHNETQHAVRPRPQKLRICPSYYFRNVPRGVTATDWNYSWLALGDESRGDYAVRRFRQDNVSSPGTMAEGTSPHKLLGFQSLFSWKRTNFSNSILLDQERHIVLNRIRRQPSTHCRHEPSGQLLQKSRFLDVRHSKTVLSTAVFQVSHHRRSVKELTDRNQSSVRLHNLHAAHASS